MRWRIDGRIVRVRGRNLQIERRASLKVALFIRRTCSTSYFLINCVPDSMIPCYNGYVYILIAINQSNEEPIHEQTPKEKD